MKVVNPTPEYELVAPKEAIIAWKHNAVTQQIVDAVKQEINNSNDRVGKGETLGENIIQDTARAVGYVEGLEFLARIMDIANFIEDAYEREGKEDTDSIRKLRGGPAQGRN